ncbi:kinase-like domain-containing protein [Crepidotus variabilis]|uniref:Kinase-like domain-containing protein n=1 Tax=Crepidotus variabilis TaxID=179855 RepID=A0A9P6JLQ3_9AGAR|nr:kinase-like domain-containing protein [Crepidotus variabilis]
MPKVSDSPPRAPPIKYSAPLGTRWAKEKAAAGGATAFDLPTDPVAIGPWILGECVGKGASGRVKIAKHRLTGLLAAVKILPIAPLVNSRTSLATQQAKSDKQRLGIDREIIMMKLMNHPNIMRIYDVYENDKELFLVLEYVEGGELFDFLVNRGRLPSAEALIYFRQIVYGLNYAHTFSIIHRDLKPENILISSLSPPLIKIADWGMAAFAPPALHLETSCGSPHYASPEIVNGEKYQGHATDVWSCGVILFALLTGRLPFDDKNVRTLLSKVKTGKYDMPSWIDPLAKDLLRKMLVVNVQDRITIPDILKHPWLTSQSTVSFLATDGKTYSLLPPPLPPSPTLLASPLASPDLIDSELFSSLKVIWGRHVDPKGESIRRDLCSPSGQGVHTKAFYFLLGKYREETLKIDADNAIKDVVMNDATSDQTTRPATPSDQLTDGLRRYQVSNSYISPSNEPTTSEAVMSEEEQDQSANVLQPKNVLIGPPPQVITRRRTITDGAFDRSLKQTHHVQLEQREAQVRKNANSSGSTRPRSSLGEVVARSGFNRPQPRRGHTSVMAHSTRDLEPPSSAPVTSLGFSRHLHQLQARTPATATFMASQRSSTQAPSLPIDIIERRRDIHPRSSRILQQDDMDAPPRSQEEVIDRPGSLPSALDKTEVPPLVDQPDTLFIRKTMGSLTQKANDLVQGVAQVPSQPTVPNFVPGSVDTSESRLSKSFRSKVKIDKENQGLDEGWSHVKYSSVHHGSVGLGVGGGLGNRDVGNTPTSPSKVRKEKEKKFRRT